MWCHIFNILVHDVVSVVNITVLYINEVTIHCVYVDDVVLNGCEMRTWMNVNTWVNQYNNLIKYMS